MSSFYLTPLLYCPSICRILLVDFFIDQEDDNWLHYCIDKIFIPSYWWTSSLIRKTIFESTIVCQNIYPILLVDFFIDKEDDIWLHYWIVKVFIPSYWWISSLLRKTTFDSTIVLSKYLCHLVGGFLLSS